jgi:lipopolysaccharide transport system ATP-binding protein
MNSSEYAIQVENISKLYRIGIKKQLHDHFAAALFDFIKKPLTNFTKYRNLYKFDDVLKGDKGDAATQQDVLWALKGISFNVKRGEVIGIIGRNGAGKSTLLKIISRITFPTTGHALIRGRISSLLEVGTGFHPELTGRENIYLNGTILGMRKQEIDRKIDDIIAFSGVERFIDTPVKRFSSGMRVRLAFSVAAHLEPDILIIDEVLAVGDADFQQKCLNAMEAVGRSGRTVLFVSHNMKAVARLCNRTILLENGKIVADGPSAQVVSRYLSSEQGTTGARKWSDPGKAPQGSYTRLRAVSVKAQDESVSESFDIRHPIYVEMEYDVLESGQLLLPHFGLNNEDGDCVFISVDLDPEWRNRPRPEGRYLSKALIPGNLLNEGMMFINAYMLTLNPIRVEFAERNAVSFNVVDSFGEDTARGDYNKTMPGVVRPKLKWSTTHLSN